MERYLKTYAVKGLIEWVMTLDVGGALIRIKFMGGSMGSNGVIPAKYTTDSPVIQRLIEESKEYKNKRIYLHTNVKIEEKKKGGSSSNGHRQ